LSNMAEDFDFSKKKKKKKKPSDLDDDAGGDTDVKTEAPISEDKPAAKEEKAEAPAASTEPAADEDLGFDLKKKKKKKKVLDLLDEEEAPPPPPADDDDTLFQEQPASTAPAAAEAEPADDDLNLLKKKKKKKPKAAEDALADIEAPTDENAPAKAAADAEGDYTYDEVLDRIFRIMREKNPEMISGDKQRIVLKPPQVHRLGTRRTAFANFTEYCKMLHRTPEHFQSFLVAELGASGSVDGSAALVLRGRFQQKQIENVLRRYIREYVTCHTCKSPDTTLTKENRLFFLKCESCGSRCSVASIRAGYQAVTSKRAAMRAKTDA